MGDRNDDGKGALCDQALEALDKRHVRLYVNGDNPRCTDIIRAELERLRKELANVQLEIDEAEDARR
jgi:hypothetical protein